MAFSNDATSLDDDFWDRKNLGGVNCSGLFTSYVTTSNVTVQKFGTSRGAVGPPLMMIMTISDSPASTGWSSSDDDYDGFASDF